MDIVIIIQTAAEINPFLGTQKMKISLGSFAIYPHKYKDGSTPILPPCIHSLTLFNCFHSVLPTPLCG